MTTDRLVLMKLQSLMAWETISKEAAYKIGVVGGPSTSYTSVRGLMSRIYKELKNLNTHTQKPQTNLKIEYATR